MIEKLILTFIIDVKPKRLGKMFIFNPSKAGLEIWIWRLGIMAGTVRQSNSYTSTYTSADPPDDWDLP